MSKVYFVNDGIIDISAMTTFGVSVKMDDNPIGYFGTGFKYAIAILLRNKHTITVDAGDERYEFSTVTKQVRGVPFDIIIMNGRELGFTTDLGKTWEVWQAYRELYCNTLDESGVITDKCVKASPTTTVVTVTGKKFYDTHQKRDEIILLSEPLHTTDHVHLHSGHTPAIFYKTIKVHEELDKRFYYSYDLQDSIELTEDRTIKHTFYIQSRLGRTIMGDNKGIIKAMLTVPQGYYENTISLTGMTPTDSFMEVMKELDFKSVHNKSAIVVYNRAIKTSMKPKSCELTSVEVKQLYKAIQFCDRALHVDVAQYKINVSDELHDDVLGMAYEGEIFIAREVFKQGTKQVASTLFEEYLHLKHKYQDETYAFQTYLFDVIMSLGEEVQDEPL